MRYRIYFMGQEAVEVDASDLRVVGSRRLLAETEGIGATGTVELLFGLPLERIADDHDRTIFQR